jgi:hypothetical protein
MLIEVKEWAHAKFWVKNAFDEWKLFSGFDTIKYIFLNKGLIKSLVDMLSSFILQVTKKNGSLYPPTKYIFCKFF